GASPAPAAAPADAAPDAEAAAGDAGPEPATPRARRGSGGVSSSGVARAMPDGDDRPLPRPARTAPRPARTAGRLLTFCRRAARADGPPAQGTWKLAFDAGGTSGQAIAVKADAAVADVRLPAETEGGEPFHLRQATLTADLLYAPGETRAVTVNAFEVTTPGAALAVQGPTTVTVGGPTTRVDGSATATATANLPALAGMLRPLGLVPEDVTAAGDVKVTLTVTPAAEAPTKVNLAVRGEQIDLAWSDGRRYADPLLRAGAVATLASDDAGEVQAVEVTDWSVATVAGALQGTARGEPTPDGWVWDATAAGDGSIQPVAHATARLLAAEPRTIGGMWHLKAAFAGRDDRLGVDLSLTDLTIPGRGEPPGPEVRLEDVRLEASASVGEAGQVRIERASLAGPGITAEVAGTARLPSRSHPHPRADGHVEAAIALAGFARVLRPFGLLAEDDRLAGQATFTGEVRTDPTGLGGSGTLNLTELEVHLAKTGSTFREAEARLPIAFAYVNEKKRWEIAATEMSAVTVHGTWRVAIEEADPAPRLEATCDLAFDGDRVRQILGQALPETIRMAGPYRAKARLAGPLPAEGPWHRRLAGMESDGSLEVNRFTYATLTGGAGTVRWKLADGVLYLSPDPDRPSRLALADGTVTLAGRIDLRGPQARLLVDGETRVVEGLPLAGRQVREYVKYASPVLAASVGASGRLTLDVLRLDLPLGEGAAEKAVGEFRYHIDDFQTELMGPIGRLVQAVGGPAQSIPQTLGPIQVTLRDGVFHIPEHNLRYTETVSLAFGGRIGLDKRMNVTVGVPVTRPLMEQYRVSERAMPYLEDVVLAVPLKGTIDNPEVDNRALAKRLGQLAAEAIKREALKHLGDWLKR
ncbi:MAG: hypothetical protein U9R68_00710, partial [Planctomycetota bacterium]|nr:hypothetical protein [Planctomycetota bacterium]